MPAQQLGRNLAGIGDSNGIGEHKTVIFRFGLLLDVGRLYLNLDMVLLLIHDCFISPESTAWRKLKNSESDLN